MFFAADRVSAAGAALMEQVAAPKSFVVRSAELALESPEAVAVAASSRNALVRSSRIFFRPWHKSSQAGYFAAAGSLRGFGSTADGVGAGWDVETDCGA